MEQYGIIGLGVLLAGGLAFLLIVLAMSFRVVVSTNDVHIVQSAKRTTSYGRGEAAGNVYWRWPSWIPIIGVKFINLPVSVFDQRIDKYHAYDKDRVPFMVDIIAFFRVTDSNLAAQRVHSFPELLTQLENILRGAIRSILATHEIHEILEGRSQFGQRFTDEVDKNLANWGVATVKTIELMDIQDAPPSKVIDNIMAKKKSAIEMESRVVVASNMREAQTKEIEAQREVELARQEATQQVGQRTAEQEKQVGIAKQVAQQEVLEAARTTAEKDMAVKQVQNVRTAEINRAVQVVQADQDKQTAVIEAEGKRQSAVIAAEAIQQTRILEAEGQKQQTVLVSEGNLTEAKNMAVGIQAKGEAEAIALKLGEQASVAAQIALAQEIGSNAEYQHYLVSIRNIEAGQAIGIEQAKALTAAEIKIIANSGGIVEGAKSVMDLLTPKGATQVGAALEAFQNTSPEVVKAVSDLANAVTGNKPQAPKPNGAKA